MKMKTWTFVVFVALTACGGNGEDTVGDDQASVDDAGTIPIDVLTDAPSDPGTDDSPEVFQPVGPHACLTDPDCTQVMVASHRGFHRILPENSLAAIRGAAELGAEFIEIDIRHTKDDVMVLMHDDTVDRTTDGTGSVDEMTWEEVEALTLSGSDPAAPETGRVPLFSEALELARDLGVMLYVDQKTGRTDLTLEIIQSGPYHDVALVRDDLGTVASMTDEDEDLLVMPAVDSVPHFLIAMELIPDVRIVEIPGGAADPEVTQAIIAHGVKVQQDALGPVDLLGAFGDYIGWKDFIEAGVWLPQTDYPDVLVPAVRQYNETGLFPESGPGRLE